MRMKLNEIDWPSVCNIIQSKIVLLLWMTHYSHSHLHPPPAPPVMGTEDDPAHQTPVARNLTSELAWVAPTPQQLLPNYSTPATAQVDPFIQPAQPAYVMRSVQPQAATTADHGTSDPDMTHERVDATASAARDPLTRSGTIMDGHFAWEPYEKMSQDLIRKECTLREIKLNTRTNKADRIKCLRHYDALVNKGEGSSAASTMASGNTRRTKHCMFRLTNVLLSKNMVTRLIETTGRCSVLSILTNKMYLTI